MLVRGTRGFFLKLIVNILTRKFKNRDCDNLYIIIPKTNETWWLSDREENEWKYDSSPFAWSDLGLLKMQEMLESSWRRSEICKRTNLPSLPKANNQWCLSITRWVWYLTPCAILDTDGTATSGVGVRRVTVSLNLRTQFGDDFFGVSWDSICRDCDAVEWSWGDMKRWKIVVMWRTKLVIKHVHDG